MYLVILFIFIIIIKLLPLGMDVSTKALMKPQEFSEEVTEFNIRFLEDTHLMGNCEK